MYPYQDRQRSTEERVTDLLGRMTRIEKVGQLNQRLYGFTSYVRQGDKIVLTEEFTNEVARWGGLGVLYGLYRADPWSQKTRETGIPREMALAAYNVVQRYVVEHSRFGIPALMSTECPHGHQALDGYLLPVNLAAGATMNPALVEEAYGVAGKQLKEMGVDLALISMLDVLRDPRWGRSEECYGEDPYLAEKLAAAAVRGCKQAGVDVVAKHFCAQGETTGGVNASAARIGPRELREIHLSASRAAIEAGAAGFMAAYNEIDGVPCHGNEQLLRGVLREELGFDGIVMADGSAIDRLMVLTGDCAGAGALALKSGVDVSLWDKGFTLLAEAAAHDNDLDAYIDAAAARVLRLKFQRGLMDCPYVDETETLPDYNNGSQKVSEEMARQSVVLLKNERALPLAAEGLTIAVIGPNGNDLYNILGDYTPPMASSAGITVLQGLQQHSQNTIMFSRGCGIFEGAQDETLMAEAVALAKKADVIVLALGGSSSRFSGEIVFDTNGAALVSEETTLQMDCGEGVDASSLALPGLQNQLAQRIFALNKKTIALVIAGRPYAIAPIAEKADALLYSIYPGPWGGSAIGEILFGKTSPSGRLPMSLPRTEGQIPCYYNYRNSYSAMQYHDTPGQPLYTFGAGQGYHPLSYGNFRLQKNVLSTFELQRGESFTLQFDCKNNADVAEYAVPMLFIRAQSGSIVRRASELKGFDKRLLPGGEQTTFTFILGAQELSVWNCDMAFLPEAAVVELVIRDGVTVLHKTTLTIQ